jgi:hypothetical protein
MKIEIIIGLEPVNAPRIDRIPPPFTRGIDEPVPGNLSSFGGA